MYLFESFWDLNIRPVQYVPVGEFKLLCCRGVKEGKGPTLPFRCSFRVMRQWREPVDTHPQLPHAVGSEHCTSSNFLRLLSNSILLRLASYQCQKSAFAFLHDYFFPIPFCEYKECADKERTKHSCLEKWSRNYYKQSSLGEYKKIIIWKSPIIFKNPK